MLIAPISLGLSPPAVSPVAPVARVVRRAPPSKGSRTSAAREGIDGDASVAAMRTPAEVSSNATRDALDNLELGG